MKNELDFECYQTREMYAHFGLAIYMVQVLDRAIAILLSTAYALNPEKMTKNDYDQLLENYFKKTMGSLLNKMKKNNPNIPVDLENRLSEALDKRNFLVHHYFWERAIESNSIAGRTKIISELQIMQKQFESLEIDITEIYKNWGKQRGVKEEDYKVAIDKLLSEPQL